MIFGTPKTAWYTPLAIKAVYVVQLTTGHVLSPCETNPYPSSAGESELIGGSGEEGRIRCVHKCRVRNGMRMYPAAWCAVGRNGLREERWSRRRREATR